MTQKAKAKPQKMLTSAHQGTINGEPRYAIWLQSKVKSPIPRPDETPNNWLTTTLSTRQLRSQRSNEEGESSVLGAIQQTQENAESAVKRKPEEKQGRGQHEIAAHATATDSPGRKYHANAALAA